MKKSILNLGKTLNKAEQKTIIGGTICMAPYCPNQFGRCVFTMGECHSNTGDRFTWNEN